jgi:hypothetical protein
LKDLEKWGIENRKKIELEPFYDKYHQNKLHKTFPKVLNLGLLVARYPSSAESWGGPNTNPPPIAYSSADNPDGVVQKEPSSYFPYPYPTCVLETRHQKKRD